MLQFDLRELASGPVDTAAQLGAEDPLFRGLGGALTGPGRVSGRLQAAGPRTGAGGRSPVSRDSLATERDHPWPYRSEGPPNGKGVPAARTTRRRTSRSSRAPGVAT